MYNLMKIIGFYFVFIFLCVYSLLLLSVIPIDYRYWATSL